MSKSEEICSVSFADTDAATNLLRDFTGSQGGIVTADWYALRDKIADKISMTRVEERDRHRTLLSEAEQREKDARATALEEAAKVAEGLLNFADALDKDMQGVKKRHQPWLDDVAANIRALQSEER